MERPLLARLVAALPLVLLATAATPAAAAPRAWQPPVALSAGAAAPAAALTSAGDVVAAWDEGAALRAAAGGATSTLDDAGGAPAVAADDAGGAFVAWRHAGSGTVRVAQRPSGGAFGTAQDLGAADGDPAVAARGDGEAALAWVRGGQIFAAVKPAGGAWGAPGPVAGPFAEAPDVHVGLDGPGDVVIVWRDANGIRAATRDAAAAGWTIETVAQTTRPSRGVQLAAGDGGSVVAWAERRDDQTSAVRVAWRGSGGPFTAPVELASTVLFDEVPRAAVDDAGHAAVVWPEGLVRADGWAGIVGPIAGVSGRLGQGFGSVKVISGAHAGKDPSVALGPGGEALVAWRDWMGGAEAARLPAGGDPGAPAPVACGRRDNTALALGIDGHGSGVLVGQDGAALGVARDAATGDEPCGGRLRVLGPSIGGRPATATAGRNAVLDGLDFIPRIYNPPTLRSEWDFDGDGRYDAAADGYQAPHVFARPGRYPVTMRLTWTWRPGMSGSEEHRTAIDVVGDAPAAARAVRGVTRHTPTTLSRARLLRRGVTVRAAAGTVVELVARGTVIARRTVPAGATRVTVRPRSRRAVRGPRLQVRARAGRRILWREVVALRGR